MSKIMIVDDSAVQRKMTIGIVRKIGYQNDILEAGDVNGAKQELNNHKNEIGLIIYDWDLPKSAALEFIKTVAKMKILFPDSLLKLHLL